ncbi:HalOD1 output domain-containing protein [Haladaptatus sp. NG-SE-30]
MTSSSANAESKPMSESVARPRESSTFSYAFRWPLVDDEPPSTSIVTALATVAALPPEQLELRIFDHTEPDALDALLTDSTAESAGLQVEFSIEGYTVRIGGDGTLTITEDAE